VYLKEYINDHMDVKNSVWCFLRVYLKYVRTPGMKQFLFAAL